MLTVHCVCWGDKYDDYYVQRLQREVQNHLYGPYQFRCVTDRQIEGVYCVKPINDLPGWWGKTNLFAAGENTERNLYLDLDVVITGDLTSLVDSYGGCNFAAPTNWAQSGHGGVQSSVMLWKGGKGCHAEWIHRYFDPAIAYWPPRNEPGVCLWGDQEFITTLRDQGRLSVTPIDAKLVKSYKYHVRPTHSVPDDCRVVVFHGDPKPSAATEDWFDW